MAGVWHYPWLSQFGTSEVPHKRYLSDYLTGHWHGSDSKGELYNDDPVSGDARMCGTTASLCGIETARRECRLDDLQAYIRRDLMLHAFMLTQSGLPILYAGDEIAQENDYTYHLDPDKAADSRFIHRGDFDWEKAEQRLIPGTVEQQIFDGLLRLEAARRSSPAFDSDARLLDAGHRGRRGPWDRAVEGRGLCPRPLQLRRQREDCPDSRDRLVEGPHHRRGAGN